MTNMLIARLVPLLCVINLLLFSCNSSNAIEPNIGLSFPIKVQIDSNKVDSNVQVAASRLDLYVPQLRGKRVGLVVNHTSFVGQKHLVDILIEEKIDVRIVFAPEHGFRGSADAGQYVENDIDKATGIPIVSLYGKHKMPSEKDLSEIDVVLFDIQDVGVRFYTYTSTMTYVMQACAKHKRSFMVLDRPNPLGFYVDGPILDTSYKSFVGLHPVPIVHGLTVGEYAKMINGEYWLGDSMQCDLEVIPCLNYSHGVRYSLPIAPSPNLPNMRAIYLYPSLCLFEGTVISVGRGTKKQFQVFGHPDLSLAFSFRPVSRSGAKYPKHEGKICFGIDLSIFKLEELASLEKLNLSYLQDMYNEFKKNKNVSFFLANGFFNKLAGNNRLKEQIEEDFTAEEIRNSWISDLQKYKKLREKYVLYN